MSSTSRQKGKRVELELAHMMGTTRNPADGLTHTDIYKDNMALEVKARKALPKWMGSAMAQAEADLKDGRTIPVVIMVQSAVGQAPQRYALMRFDDFLSLIMPVERRGDDEAN